MKIKSIELYLAEIKLKQVFTTSLGARSATYNVFVKIVSDNGLIGWGECAPNPRINGETAGTCMQVGQLIGQQLIGRNPCEHDIIMALMDSVIFGNTSIKTALDIACYDLAAKANEQPLYAYLGGNIDKKIFTDYTVSVNNIHQMVSDAKDIKEQGFPAIKVKLGDGKADDIKRIQAIREAVGKEIDIRVDANQGWKANEAIIILNELRELGVQYCEEPISRRLHYKLKKIRKKSSTPIMADESMFDHHDARYLIKMGHCDMLNIKLGKSSGLFKGMKIIEAAEKVDMKMQIGGFLESRLVITANCHLAHCSGLVQYYDFDSPLFHRIDPINGGVEYQSDWELRLPDSPGLGLHIDEDFLKTCDRASVR
jgi:L-alanine-DL-glutamate epimerase-like enolase superfamily enzyme